MTNGEKFRKTFKNVPCGVSNDKKFINAWYTEDGYCIIPIEWWNAEYKEPTIKNDLEVDCISRKAVLDLTKRTMINYFGESIGEVVYVKDIMKLPSAIPQEPRKGHWIPVFQGDEIIDYRCSCCEFGNTFGKETVGMNYCPRCGSRNEVEK